jgi:hypothetical protein
MLLLLLGNAWTAIFLVACERGLRGLGVADASALAPLSLARRRVATLAALAAAATLAQIALSGLFYPGRLPGWTHVALAVASLALQAAFWWSARRALRVQHALALELERRS